MRHLKNDLYQQAVKRLLLLLYSLPGNVENTIDKRLEPLRTGNPAYLE